MGNSHSSYSDISPGRGFWQSGWRGDNGHSRSWNETYRPSRSYNETYQPSRRERYGYIGRPGGGYERYRPPPAWNEYPAHHETHRPSRREHRNIFHWNDGGYGRSRREHGSGSNHFEDPYAHANIIERQPVYERSSRDPRGHYTDFSYDAPRPARRNWYW